MEECNCNASKPGIGFLIEIGFDFVPRKRLSKRNALFNIFVEHFLIDLAFSFVNVDFILTSFAISNIPFIRHSLRETKLTDRQDAEYVNKTHFGEDCGALDVAPDVMSVNVCTRKSYTFYSVLETPQSKLLTGEK